MGSEAIEQKIRRFLVNDLDVRNQVLDIDDPLLTTALVDSAGLVRLAALFEEEVGIEIPDRDVTVANFETIARILAYLKSRTGD